MAPQVFTGQVPESEVRVDQPHTVRSVQFQKAAADTRLRITYRDKASTAFSPAPYTVTVVVRIDGVDVPLLSTVFDASVFGQVGNFELLEVKSPFTTVGWVPGIAAGTHLLETRYVVNGPNGPVIGYVSGSPYLIEIEELP